MKRAILIGTVLLIAVISTACINNFAVQELNTKAKIYLEKGDFEAAINRLEASIDLDNTIFETNYNLGVAYIKANKNKKAYNILKKAVEINPDSADAYYSLGIAAEEYAEDLEDLKNVSNKSDFSQYDSDDINKDLVLDADDQNLSESDKRELVLSLYAEAIKAYTTYIEKNSKASDIESIKNQIKDIEEHIAELKDKK